MSKNGNDVTEAIALTVEKLKELAGADILTGRGVKTEDGGFFVPFSAVTVMYLVGTGEYGKVSIFSKNPDLPNMGASGAVVTMKPSAFLTYKDGNFTLLKVAESAPEKALNIAEKLFADKETVSVKKVEVNGKPAVKETKEVKV